MYKAKLGSFYVAHSFDLLKLQRLFTCIYEFPSEMLNRKKTTFNLNKKKIMIVSKSFMIINTLAHQLGIFKKHFDLFWYLF